MGRSSSGTGVSRNNATTRAYIIDPYVKATFGPVFVEAEAYYGGGKLLEYEGGPECRT